MEVLETILFSELGVLIVNLGLLILGAYFWSQTNRFWAKVAMSAPMFALHFAVLPAVLIGCEFSLIENSFCRESIWLFVVIPPFIFGLGIIQLIVYLVMKRGRPNQLL